MATINGVEVAGDKSAHDFRLLDDSDKTEIENNIERNREATEDNHEDIVRHRTDTDVHVTPEWKNSLVTKEILGLYWTAAQTADIINEISIAGGAKLLPVAVLPETGQEQTIYLVPKTDPEQGDVFDEYVWIDNKFEFIGTSKAKLSGYFPITGGALTGNIIERNTDNDHLGVSGSYWGHGAYLWLSGQNSGYGGAWYLSARDTEKSCDLIGSPAGVLSWGGKLVATEEYVDNSLTDYATKTELNAKANVSDLSNYLPLSGGAMTGAEIRRNADNSNFHIYGGTSWNSGASVYVFGKDSADRPGAFSLDAYNGNNLSRFVGNPDGSLTWNGKNIDVIEEQGDGYIRYSNGLQICFKRYVARANTDTPIALPKPFIDTNYNSLLANYGGLGPACSIASYTTITMTGFSIKNIDVGDLFVDVISIGKWK